MNQHKSTITAVMLDRFIPCALAVECLAESAARRLEVVPIGLVTKPGSMTLLVGSSEPDNEIVSERLSRQLSDGIDTQFVKVDAEKIPDALNRCYQHRMSVTDFLHCCISGSAGDQLERQLPDVTVRLVEALLLEAVRLRASDIHLSPEDSCVQVRLRVDGVLIVFIKLDNSLFSSVVVRLKILCSMDIAESRLPQDGQFVQWINEAYIDFRVSTFPTITGENLVIRVLNSQSYPDGLDSLKLPATTVQDLSKVAHMPDGMVIICGPTGSGKTTTLYALLNELDKSALNIMTLEDPVEVVVAGLRQTSIDAARSLDYSHGIRALLRQDPDVLMLGEVRDKQSCTMALRAVMTGHRVFSTVHASDALGAIERLIELGAQAQLLAAHLRCVASQRLIRLICAECCASSIHCTKCKGTGFFGRQVVMELILVGPSFAAHLVSGAAASTLQAEIVKGGYVSMRDQALKLVEQGATTLEELQRVLGPAPDAIPGDKVVEGNAPERICTVQV